MDRKWLIVLVIIFLTGTSGMSSAVDLGIITGSKQGTYFQFGLDMMKVVKQYGLDLEVYNSRGSVENVYAVYKRPDIHSHLKREHSMGKNPVFDALKKML